MCRTNSAHAAIRSIVTSSRRRGLAQSRNARARRLAKTALLLGLGVAATARAAALPAWPPFLPPRDTFSPAVVATVEKVWQDPTLTRTVDADPVETPLDVYRVFFDMPDVTTAAARHLGLARYEVRRVSQDTYEADDRAGARGRYRVLVQAPGRRVLLSTGRHESGLLGTVRGDALTMVTLEAREGATAPRLVAYVRIEHAVAAALARALVPVFGYLADRKLREGFRVTAKVSEWAWRSPGEFCGWLEDGAVSAERAAVVAAALGRCASSDQALTSYRRPRHSIAPSPR